MLRRFPQRWLQFSLRTFLVLITVAAFVGGLAWIKYRDDRDYAARREHWLSIGCMLEVEETPVWFGLHTRRKIVGLWTDNTHEIRVDGIEQETELRRVSITWDSLNDEQCALLATLPKLQKLNVRFSGSDPATIGKLSRLSELTQLSIVESFLSEDSIEQFNKLPALRELSLSGSFRFTGGWGDRLRIPTLEKLDVTGCPLQTLDLSQHGFGGMPLLKELIVKECELNRLIVDTTKLQLRRLDLRGNHLTRLQGLAAAAPQLETLLLDRGNLNSIMIADLRQLRGLKQLILSPGYSHNEYPLVGWQRLEKDLPGIAAQFDFPVLIEDYPYTKPPQPSAYRAPVSFEPELPLISAEKK